MPAHVTDCILRNTYIGATLTSAAILIAIRHIPKGVTVTALNSLMNPRAIAVVGASPSPGPGANVIDNLTRSGFTGRVVGVNPRHRTVGAFDCVPSLADVSGKVDAVVVAVNADRAIETLKEAEALGIPSAVVLGSGFGEGRRSSESQRARGDVIRGLASRGMAICGPNCYGVWNLHSGSAAFSGNIVEEPRAGNVALISQSGGVVNIVGDRLMEDLHVGMSYLISCGNQLGTTVEDFARYLVDDTNTTVVGIHVEGFRSATRLKSIAATAHAQGKSIVVFKPGRSQEGRAAVQAHSASIAGDGRVAEAALQDYGIIQTDTVDSFIGHLSALSRAGKLREGIRRDVIVVTGSGGESANIADAVYARGLTLTSFDDDLRRRIESTLPDFGEANNPLDGTGVMFQDEQLFSSLLDTFTSYAARNLLLLNIEPRAPRTGPFRMKAFVESLSRFAESSALPILAYSAATSGLPDPEVMERLRATDIPFVAGTSNAADVARSLFQVFGTGEDAAPASNDAPAATGAETQTAAESDVRVLSFAKTAEILAEYGIPVAVSRFCQTPQEAVSAAREIGYPVVVKADADGLAHKSELNAVALNLATDDEVIASFEKVTSSVAAAGYQDVCAVVQPMRSGLAEVMMGVVDDAEFGRVVTFGIGGRLVELLDDVSIGLPPFTEDEAMRLMTSSKASVLLEGFRGSARADIAGLVRVVRALGDFANDYPADLVALDINPVLVGAEGAGCVAVDAVLMSRG